MKEHIISKINKIIPLTEANKEQLRASFIVKQLQSKEYLLKSGELCKFECFVHKGILRSYYCQGEEERITHFSMEGDWVSDYNSLLTKQKSRINIQALEETELLSISPERLEELGLHIPNWDRVGRLFFEKQLREKEKEMELRIALSAEKRYVKLLNEEPIILKRVSLNMIAKYLGIKAESLSRIRKRLASKK